MHPANGWMWTQDRRNPQFYFRGHSSTGVVASVYSWQLSGQFVLYTKELITVIVILTIFQNFNSTWGSSSTCIEACPLSLACPLPTKDKHHTQTPSTPHTHTKHALDECIIFFLSLFQAASKINLKKHQITCEEGEDHIWYKGSHVSFTSSISENSDVINSKTSTPAVTY